MKKRKIISTIIFLIFLPPPRNGQELEYLNTEFEGFVRASYPEDLAEIFIDLSRKNLLTVVNPESGRVFTQPGIYSEQIDARIESLGFVTRKLQFDASVESGFINEASHVFHMGKYFSQEKSLNIGIGEDFVDAAGIKIPALFNMLLYNEYSGEAGKGTLSKEQIQINQAKSFFSITCTQAFFDNFNYDLHKKATEGFDFNTPDAVPKIYAKHSKAFLGDLNFNENYEYSFHRGNLTSTPFTKIRYIISEIISNKLFDMYKEADAKGEKQQFFDKVYMPLLSNLHKQPIAETMRQVGFENLDQVADYINLKVAEHTKVLQGIDKSKVHMANQASGAIVAGAAPSGVKKYHEGRMTG